MTEEIMLEALRVDLGISTTAYDSRLAQVLQAAASEIAREGITLDETSISDGNLQVMYAAWLWRRRDTGSGMPRMLRWAMNNRLFEEKTQDEGESE